MSKLTDLENKTLDKYLNGRKYFSVPVDNEGLNFEIHVDNGIYMDIDETNIGSKGALRLYDSMLLYYKYAHNFEEIGLVISAGFELRFKYGNLYIDDNDDIFYLTGEDTFMAYLFMKRYLEEK